MKHAYLIIANKNPKQLQKLIYMIDDYRNDIYLMIDKKSLGFPKKFSSNFSNVFILDPINIYWGNYTQVQAEINLFEAAYENNKYDYFHLISGADLPLASQNEIHKFFDQHPNKEFIKYTETLDLSLIQIFVIKFRDAIRSILKKDKIDFLGKNKVRRILEVRVKRHFFKNNQKGRSKLYVSLERNLLLLLPQFRLKRKNIDIASQWVSIDNDLVKLIVENKELIKKIYSKGVLVDEIFIPTLINYHPKFKKKIYDSSPSHYNKNKLQGNLRYINWWDSEDGYSPYTWKKEDYDTLVNAKENGHLFARKFDENVDSEIIEMIYRKVMNEEK